MNSPEFESCPGCGRKSESVEGSSAYVVAQCSACGFSASTLDVVRADYLANFYPLPDVRIAAQRIKNRSMLKYSTGRRMAS